MVLRGDSMNTFDKFIEVMTIIAGIVIFALGIYLIIYGITVGIILLMLPAICSILVGILTFIKGMCWLNNK
jgi:hypothetical protein